MIIDLLNIALTSFLLALGVFLAIQFPYLLIKRADLRTDFAGLHSKTDEMLDAWQRYKEPGRWWHDFKNLFGMAWARTNLQRAIKFWWSCIGIVMVLWALDRIWL